MSSQKIVVISLDHWNYDKHIISDLQSKGITSQHINFGDYKHPSFFSRIKNFFYKVFLKKNLKKILRQEYIIEKLETIGKQDQILVINPDLIEKKYHLMIKEHTHKYIAYLYDSVARYPVQDLLEGVFDEIYSFDTDDVKKYNFKPTTNYNYLEKKDFHWIEAPNYQLFYLASFDDRIALLSQIAQKLNAIKVTFRFIIVTKKVKEIPFIEIRKERINQEDLGEFYNQTNVILDLVRDQQTGLSFRIFEAMAYQKKIITSNAAVRNYDFYNPNNILVLDENNLQIDASFFTTKYQPIPNEIYQKYTLSHWVDTIFEL